jgi:hypothetical protein
MVVPGVADASAAARPAPSRTVTVRPVPGVGAGAGVGAGVGAGAGAGTGTGADDEAATVNTADTRPCSPASSYSRTSSSCVPGAAWTGHRDGRVTEVPR